MSNCCNDLEPLGQGEVDVLHVSRGFSRRDFLRGSVGAAGLAALGGVASTALGEQRQIKLAFCSQLLCVVPYEATRAAGFFAEEGLDVELVYTRGGSAALQALNGGAVDYAATSFDAALNAHASGADIVRFASTGRLPLFALATSPQLAGDIDGVDKLANRTVGVSALGNADHAFMLYLLERAGVDVRSVEFATIGTNLYDAIRLGQLDAGMVQEPALTLLQEQGSRVLVNGMDIDDARTHLGGAYEFMGVAVRRDQMDERVQEMQALGRALSKGLEYVQTATPDALVDSLPREIVTGGDRDRLAATLAQYRASLYPQAVKMDRESMQRVIDVHRTAGSRGGHVELDQIIAPEILG